MRELHEGDTGDGADTGTDSGPDVAAGHGGDSRRRAIATVRDAATRTALALEYRRRVEAGDAASGAPVAAPPDERADRAHATSGKGDHASGPPAGQDTGDRRDDHRREDMHSQDTARRPTRGADLPVSARELPSARDVLPNLEMAEIDERKFSEYSLNPGHPDNRGKAGGWRALGYDVDSPQGRRDAAQELRGIILSELLACGKVEATRDTPRGLSHRVLNGITGPNGKVGTLVTCWRIEDHSGTGVPRLVTTWAQPHRDKETEQ
jgi:hypothetical protein